MNDLRKHLVSRVKDLGVEERVAPGRDDGFSALFYEGKEFAHFHHDNELDIRLTKAVIRRENLVHPPGSTRHPKRGKTSHWIELRFDTPAEVDQVVRLVEVAIAEMRSLD